MTAAPTDRRIPGQVDSFMTRMEAQLTAILQNSTVAKALRYALTRGLTLIVDDGWIQIDSKLSNVPSGPLAEHPVSPLASTSNSTLR